MNISAVNYDRVAFYTGQTIFKPPAFCSGCVWYIEPIMLEIPPKQEHTGNMIMTHNLKCLQGLPFLSEYWSTTDHSMYISGFSCTPVASISVIILGLSGYRYGPLFIHSGLLPL